MLKRAPAQQELVQRRALAVLFLVSGSPKVARTRRMREMFEFYRLPGWFLVVTGLVELGAAAALARPGTARAGGGLVTLIMVGAAATNATNRKSWPLILVNLVVGALGVRVARRRPSSDVPAR